MSPLPDPPKSASAPPRCGTVAVVGRPNVGKSTLVNALLGRKLAIVSPRPGTTRDRILGVLTRPEAQIILLDTPGFGPARTLLDKRLLATARGSWTEAEVLIILTDAGRGLTEEDRRLILSAAETRRPMVLAINKIDRVAKPKLLPQMAAAAHCASFTDVIPISATTRDGVDRLLEVVIRHLPEGRALFPADQLTDRSTRFLASELIREQALLVLREEVPHALAVQIDELILRRQRTRRRVRGHERRGPSRPMTYVRATLVLERPSQKGILIGAGGERLKAIGTAARQALEPLFGNPVYLDLWVKVWPRWREQPQALKQLGY